MFTKAYWSLIERFSCKSIEHIDKFLSNILTREYISQTWMTILYIIALPFISPVLFRDSNKIGNNADFNYTYAHAHMIEKKESSAMNHEQRWLVSKCYRKRLKSGCGPITITEWSRNRSFDMRSHEKFYYFLVSPNASEFRFQRGTKTSSDITNLIDPHLIHPKSIGSRYILDGLCDKRNKTVYRTAMR